jgi:hypothetical protein
VNTQQIGSLVRQGAAFLGLTAAIVTQAVHAVHLPPAISGTLLAVSGGILAVEHYVSDPSTGTPTATPVGQRTASGTSQVDQQPAVQPPLTMTDAIFHRGRVLGRAEGAAAAQQPAPDPADVATVAQPGRVPSLPTDRPAKNPAPPAPTPRS